MTSGVGLLDSGKSNLCLVRKTEFIRVSRPQKFLAVQNLLFVLHPLWLGDLCISYGLLQYLVLFGCTLAAGLELVDDPAHFCNPSRIITVESLNVNQALAIPIVRNSFFPESTCKITHLFMVYHNTALDERKVDIRDLRWSIRIHLDGLQTSFI